MTIQAGDRIPAVTLKTMTAKGIEDVSTEDFFGGKKVVLFGVPGAFTPTCSDAHLPGYKDLAEQMKERGADLVACVSVNDIFVMVAWAKARGVESTIAMLSDGNGDFARAAGLELDASGFGMGKRLRRFGAIVDDGVVKTLNVEPGGGVHTSGAETLLEALG